MTRIGFSEAARDDRRAITAHTVEQFGEHAVRFGVGVVSRFISCEHPTN